MKEKLEFLIEVHKLKEIPRSGWVLMKVEKPETIADHIFHVAIFGWIIGREKGLKAERLIKIGLVHDLCEVYAGDMTPFLYWDGLDREKKEDEAILLKGVRLSREEKEKRSREKFEKEKESFLKLLSPLEPKLRGEFFSLWLSLKKRFPEEGKLMKQIDRIQTLLQAILYFGPKEISGGTSWWELTEEIVEDELLLELLKVIQRRFYGKVRDYKRNKKLEKILDFVLKVGRLKEIPRLYWVLRGIKNPETVAGHIFTLSIMAWVFGRERGELNQEKFLKMALCHELSAVYTGDTTPYDRILPKDEKEREEVLKKMIRLSKKEKEWIFLKDYKTEKRALEKLTKGLDRATRKEILDLWHEYRTRNSLEAKFLGQLNILAVLLQGLLYEKKYKEFSASPLWEWAFENCDDKICVSLMDEMKKKFYG